MDMQSMVEGGKHMLFTRLFTYIHPAPPLKSKVCTLLYCLIDLLFPQYLCTQSLSNTSYNLKSPPCGSNIVSFAKEDPEW